ncbi:MAG: phosphatidylglycerol lysyltransferase domain-containing protein [Phycisphaerae bacterium]
MDWKEISIDDKELFDRYFWMKQYAVSDFTFTNLFIWHFSRLIHFAVVNDFLCVRVTYSEQPPVWFMPLGNGDLGAVLDGLEEDCKEREAPFRMRALSKGMVEEIEQARPGKFSFMVERDRFDYVYLVSDLIKLDGAKYKGKRNHINIFQQMYHYEYLPLSADVLREVTEAEIEWCKKRDCESHEGLENEKKGILQAVEYFDRLKFQGGVLKINGKAGAFTFGESLTKDTVVIHIEKADPDIRGAYQMITQQFLEHEWPGMTFVNREEDLGIDGLRKAKQSYHPVKLIEKYVGSRQ